MNDANAAHRSSSVEWRPIPGTEHEASSDGQIRSTDREIRYRDGRVRQYPSQIIRQCLNRRDNRFQVRIRDNHRGLRSFQVHALVCAAFHGPKPSPELWVRHLNGISTDNRAENLRWGTAAENAQDTIRHGHHRGASMTHCKRGHEMTDENTYRCRSRGDHRQCLACIRLGSERRTERRRQRRLLRQENPC